MSASNREEQAVRDGSIPAFARDCVLRGLGLDDVVDGQHFSLTGVDPDLFQDRTEARAKRFHVFLGIPDLADLQVALGAEAKFVVQSLSREDPGLIEAPNYFVVLLRR